MGMFDPLWNKKALGFCPGGCFKWFFSRHVNTATLYIHLVIDFLLLQRIIAAMFAVRSCLSFPDLESLLKIYAPSLSIWVCYTFTYIIALPTCSSETLLIPCVAMMEWSLRSRYQQVKWNLSALKENKENKRRAISESQHDLQNNCNSISIPSK